ncbi:MAG: hydrogenase maturation nickel metallochaperone HypA [Alphaproteobacteria bacterium]|nr:hydrogenase maturation nickel metallochaperone HypA [Alphaproteobacteria bacterium]
MHEMALSESMILIIEQEAVRQRFDRVKTVCLEIGVLSHAEPEAMGFCFEAVSRGTVAEGARLEIQRPPGEAWCMDCAGTIEIARRFDPCPRCGGHQLQVTGGEELRVKELEVV